MDEKKKIILEVKNISKKFNNTPIIDKLSFKISKGEIVNVDGPNGSGKTTLLKIIAQIYNFDSGKIMIKQNNLKNSTFAKSLISYCSTETIFYKDFTVRENILFYFRLIGEENPKMLLQENKDFQQINKFLNLYPDQLSDGQRKKMNLFRSLIPIYELYLLDEHDIGLDKESIKDLNLLIDKIHKRGESIIFTSHNQNVLGIKNNISQTISL